MEMGLGFRVWGLGFRVWGLGFSCFWGNEVPQNFDFGCFLKIKCQNETMISVVLEENKSDTTKTYFLLIFVGCFLGNKNSKQHPRISLNPKP